MRLVSRLTTELALMNLRGSLELVPGRLDTSIVGQALIRCGLPQLIGREGLVLPGDTPLIGSVGSVARSFGRSAETIRRHVHTLATRGFFTVERGGVRLAPTAEAGGRILAYLRQAHDNMLWLISELNSWGLIDRRPRRATPAPLETIIRTAMDLRLLGFETFRGPLGGWTSMSLWNALSAVSVRHITANRRLSRMFIRRSTPDSMRRSTSLRALCAVSGLPYATVWRHLAALEEAGKVGRSGEDYIMLTGQLLTEDMEARVADYVQDALHRANKLVAAGVDPAAIPSIYFGEKPSLVPIR